ncbi:phytanoyl-CoA dioxygenase family protein [Streptomyces sp. NPDC058001]|uniref:phytanoyl-CoA dioxygenase family protein n=1 Tax=Streptomyces sp. NPDC058001 TaxID=3346300 RepID=UPI0036E81B13
MTGRTDSDHTRSALPPASAIPVSSAADDPTSRFDQDGYAVLPDVLMPEEVAELRAETLRICRGERGAVEGAPPPLAGGSDDDILRGFLCVHYPHKLSALMLDTMRHPAIVGHLTTVIGPDIKSMQSMLFVKSEGRPGQAWHQDEMFIPTRDRSLTAAWLALDDATVDNGCLWVLPGSHRPGVIYPNREHDDARYDCTVESYDFPYEDADAVPVEIAAGSVLLFNGYLLHKSLPNTGRRGFRRALVNHYMRASSLLPWAPPEAQEPMAQADFRDITLVAGHDPYAYKGITDIRAPRVRRDRSGGCDR